jgi:hypothetical protein
LTPRWTTRWPTGSSPAMPPIRSRPTAQWPAEVIDDGRAVELLGDVESFGGGHDAPLACGLRRDSFRLPSPCQAMVRRAESAFRNRWRGRGTAIRAIEGSPHENHPYPGSRDPIDANDRAAREKVGRHDHGAHHRMATRRPTFSLSRPWFRGVRRRFRIAWSRVDCPQGQPSHAWLREWWTSPPQRSRGSTAPSLRAVFGHSPVRAMPTPRQQRGPPPPSRACRSGRRGDGGHRTPQRRREGPGEAKGTVPTIITVRTVPSRFRSPDVAAPAQLTA